MPNAAAHLSQQSFTVSLPLPTTHNVKVTHSSLIDVNQKVFYIIFVSLSFFFDHFEVTHITFEKSEF